MPAAWEAIAARKQSLRQSLIPQEWVLYSPPSASVLNVLDVPRTCGILTPRELEITSSHDATSLAAAIRSKSYSCEEVAVAFCKRAAVAQQVCNCLTEITFDSAVMRARWLDEEAREGRWRALHGVPVSLKDTFRVKGVDSSIGIASLAEKPAAQNSLMVDILLDAGAVVYCKTNVPQTLMSLDSENNLFGRVLNPRNRAATAGGSSGGEGALIAMRGSILGIGTDVGGSIRIPAMCNGLYGIKPSAQRVPYIGQENGTEKGSSKIGLPASAGPIASSLRDCELLLKVVADAKPWEQDPTVVHGEWENLGRFEGRKPLFGVMRTDHLITPLPPIQKVLEETVQKLRGSGYEVVEMETSLFNKCQSLANAFFGIGGGNYMFDLLEATGEPLVTWLSSRMQRKKAIDLKTLVEIHAKRMELEREMLKIWKTKDGRTIDAFICPVAPHPVPPIDRWNGVSYTSSFVLLDYPAATLPVRDFVKEDLKGEVVGEVLSSWDKVNRDLWNEKAIDRKVYLDTKLSLQVVAPKLQEYRLCRAIEVIDNVLHQAGHEKAKL